MKLIGYFLAACIGLSLGLLGGGGSVLALPILVYIMGIEPKPAIAMTLIIVGIVSLIGTIPHWQKGNVNLKKALMFGSATMIGSFLGAKLASLPFITDTFQLILFSVMMLLAAILMIKKEDQKLDKVKGKNPLIPELIARYFWLIFISQGLGIGILTGLVGVGGGFAIVPALVLLGKTPIKEAIGTSLLIISFNSVAGFLGYLGHFPCACNIVTSFTILAGLGTFIGAYFSQFIPPQKLQKSFGYFLIAVSVFILVKQ